MFVIAEAGNTSMLESALVIGNTLLGVLRNSDSRERGASVF